GDPAAQAAAPAADPVAGSGAAAAAVADRAVVAGPDRAPAGAASSHAFTVQAAVDIQVIEAGAGAALAAMTVAILRGDERAVELPEAILTDDEDVDQRVAIDAVALVFAVVVEHEHRRLRRHDTRSDRLGLDLFGERALRLRIGRRV